MNDAGPQDDVVCTTGDCDMPAVGDALSEAPDDNRYPYCAECLDVLGEDYESRRWVDAGHQDADVILAERQRIWAAIRGWTEVAHRLGGDGNLVAVDDTEFQPLSPFFDELHAMVFPGEYLADAEVVERFDLPTDDDLDRVIDLTKGIPAAALLPADDLAQFRRKVEGHAVQRESRQFMSNACIHEEHGQCEKECSFCHDGCACTCHPWNDADHQDESSTDE